VLEIEERDEVVPRHVDRGLLLIGQDDQAVAGPLAEPADRLGDGDLPRLDRDGLDLIVGKVVGPDPRPVPVRLLVRQPTHGCAERSGFTHLAVGDVDQRDVFGSHVEDVHRFAAFCAVGHGGRLRRGRARLRGLSATAPRATSRTRRGLTGRCAGGRDESERGTARTFEERATVEGRG
jgi:hypothetical protein